MCAWKSQIKKLILHHWNRTTTGHLSSTESVKLFSPASCTCIPMPRTSPLDYRTKTHTNSHIISITQPLTFQFLSPHFIALLCVETWFYQVSLLLRSLPKIGMVPLKYNFYRLSQRSLNLAMQLLGSPQITCYTIWFLTLLNLISIVSTAIFSSIK